MWFPRASNTAALQEREVSLSDSCCGRCVAGVGSAQTLSGDRPNPRSGSPPAPIAKDRVTAHALNPASSDGPSIFRTSYPNSFARRRKFASIRCRCSVLNSSSLRFWYATPYRITVSKIRASL